MTWCYALLPIIDSKNMDKHITRVVNNLLKLKKLTISLKELSFGIEWLIVDKYVTDEEERNILCDLLGDKMSLIHEYGQRKEEKGIEQGKEIIIRNMLKAGQHPRNISLMTKVPLSVVNRIKLKYGL